MNNFSCLDVVVSPDLPKMKLGLGDYVTPEFRKEIDDWLLVFFGTYNLIPDDQSFVSQTNNTVWMNPRTYAALKEKTRQCTGPVEVATKGSAI